MMLYTVAIVFAHAVLAVQADNPFHRLYRPGDDLEALCEGKPVLLRTVNELKKLNSNVGGSKCSDQVKAAIPDLLSLIERTKIDMCAQASIDKLREFYSKYLDTSSEQNKKREQLPKSLKKFALAYGMQMSSACKRHMVDRLKVEGRDILYTEMQRAIRNLVSDASPVADMLEGLAGPDEILLPGDLAPYIKDKQQGEDDPIYVQSATAPYIRNMQASCNRLFAPLYKPLIRPIVQLANMGFNYKDEPLRCDMDCARISSQLAKWSRLVFLCESLNNLRMVDVTVQDDSAGAQTQTVRILTKEEAAALEIEGLNEPPQMVRERQFGPVVINDGLIYNWHDKKLKKAIRAFSTSKSEEEKVARRMTGKGIALFKIQLKRANFGLLFSTGYKSLMHRIRTGENLKPNEQIVKILDGAIGHESDFQDKTLDGTDKNGKWEEALEIAGDIGLALAAAILGTIYIALISFALTSLIFAGCALFSG